MIYNTRLQLLGRTCKGRRRRKSEEERGKVWKTGRIRGSAVSTLILYPDTLWDIDFLLQGPIFPTGITPRVGNVSHSSIYNCYLQPLPISLFFCRVFSSSKRISPHLRPTDVRQGAMEKEILVASAGRDRSFMIWACFHSGAAIVFILSPCDSLCFMSPCTYCKHSWM